VIIAGGLFVSSMGLTILNGGLVVCVLMARAAERWCLMRLTTQDKIDLYRKVLQRYEDEGDDRADIQRRLIARLESDLRDENAARDKRRR